jgi:TonB family protein
MPPRYQEETMSDRYQRTPRGPGVPIAWMLAPLLALPAALAQQLAPPQVVGAALHLSDASCSAPEPQVLYQFALAVQHHVAAQAKPEEFPQRALHDNLQGTVHLRLSYAAKQEQPRADVERSSGHPVLDDYAVMLASSASLPPPESLRCRSFDIAFPLRFRVFTVPPPAGR